MDKKPVILLTSAGSLVGQGLLDVLRSRREAITIIGANSYVEHDNLRECDNAIQLPSTNDDEYIGAVENICQRFGVDLVIPCRDEDVYKLAFAANIPHSRINLINKRVDLIRIFRDKWESSIWGEHNELAFCPTLCTDDPQLELKIAEFLEKWGYPLIAKPRFGNASTGVRIILSRSQFESALTQSGIVIQPYLQHPSIQSLDFNPTLGLPLFWEVAPITFKSLTFVIGKNGDSSQFICTTAYHRLGRLERLDLDQDESLRKYAQSLLGVFLEMGWRGPVNVQAKRDNSGRWRVFEVNPRFTGGTSSRQLLDFDEVAFILNDWFGRKIIPDTQVELTTTVIRTLRESPIYRM